MLTEKSNERADAWTPRPPSPKPPIARQHCRHYDYVLGMRPGNGPKCAAGVDNTGPGGTCPCMPPELQRGAVCEKREDWTTDERAAWRAWQAEHTERLLIVLAAIPQGFGPGELDCPGCGVGRVRWLRAPNKHLHAACNTPNCFGVIQ